MFLTETRCKKILKSKWLRVFVVIGSLNCVFTTLLYLRLCDVNWLEIAKGLFWVQYAMVSAVSYGTITFGLTLDHPVIKKMVVKMVYSQRISSAIKKVLPFMILKVQEKQKKQAEFLQWHDQAKLQWQKYCEAQEFYQKRIYPLLHPRRKQTHRAHAVQHLAQIEQAA